LVALAKATLLEPDVGEEVVGLLTRVSLDDYRNGYRPTPLSQDWLHPALGTDLEAWRAAFDENLGRDARDFARGVLVHAARDLVRPQVGSNPTWPKPPLRRRRRSTGEILLKHANLMIEDLRGFEVHTVERRHTLLVADARQLPLQDAQADGILTSPPYLSRIDYPRATLPELLVLGEEDGQELGRLRSKTMGGVTTGGARPGAESADVTVAEILKKIQSHPSKASKSYYLVLAERYFADLRKCVREMVRVLRPGGRGSIVVQTSYYKDVLIDLPNIVAAMLKTEGVSASVPQSLPVSQHYGRLSPHQRGYVANKTLTEAVVDFNL
jgi:ubiquinone/menaquinone biosynthesis C-methylase UbiE